MHVGDISIFALPYGYYIALTVRQFTHQVVSALQRVGFLILLLSNWWRGFIISPTFEHAGSSACLYVSSVHSACFKETKINVARFRRKRKQRRYFSFLFHLRFVNKDEMENFTACVFTLIADEVRSKPERGLQPQKQKAPPQ